MFPIKMTHHATFCPDGTVHVQNFVAWMSGQHHVHSKASYLRWKEETKSAAEEAKGTCNCGLKPGQVREYDGRVWSNPRFGDKPPSPRLVYDRRGTRHGRLTGGSRPCRVEGCGARRLGVRWPDGKLTWPCTKGMKIRKDGEYQIV